MSRVTERFNRLLPCPNDIAIESSNFYTSRVLQIYEESKATTQHIDDLLAVSKPILSELGIMLGKLVDETGDVELAEIRGEITGYSKILDSIESPEAGPNSNKPESVINNAAVKMGELACSRCGGIVVDRRTGVAYCGREVPQEVVQANQQM
jgi:hypothetical protein